MESITTKVKQTWVLWNGEKAKIIMTNGEGQCHLEVFPKDNPSYLPLYCQINVPEKDCIILI